MRRLWMLPLAMCGTLFFPSCSSTSSGPVVHAGPRTSNNPMGLGPFDAKGNYVEAWADAPHKWPKRQRDTAPAPSLPIPSIDPVVPLAPQPAALVASDPAGNPPAVTRLPELAALTPATPKTPDKPAASKPAASKPTASKATASAKPTASKTTKAVASKTTKAVASKPKSKAPTSYTVKKGDTLYDLSKRFGTPVAAIQKANGLKGSNIGIGKKLVIPRY